MTLNATVLSMLLCSLRPADNDRVTLTWISYTEIKLNTAEIFSSNSLAKLILQKFIA